MGRLLRRVPIDFEWKIGKIWSGYMNPHMLHECQDCQGTGFSKEYNAYQDEWYSFDHPDWRPNPFRKNARYNAAAWSNNVTKEDVAALIKADRLWDFTRVPINEEQEEIVRKKKAEGENSWLPFNNGYIPTPEEVNEWNLKTMGHDSLNCWVVIKARLKREGKSYRCQTCKGTGQNWQHPKAKRLYNGWKNYDPPTGEGYQLWEDTSEGSPSSPVFSTLDELAEWCELNATTFANFKATKQEWIDMLTGDNVHHQEGNAIFV